MKKLPEEIFGTMISAIYEFSFCNIRLRKTLDLRNKNDGQLFVRILN